MERSEIEATARGLFANLRGELRLPPAVAAAAEIAPAERVTTVAGEPSYWLVPVLGRDRLAGFLRLSLDGRLLAWGRFGDGDDLPPAGWLSAAAARAALDAAFADRFGALTPPRLVHDGPPERLAWLARATSREHGPALLFWAFGETYWRREGQPPPTGMVDDG